MKHLYITLNIGNLNHGAGGWIRTINILKEFKKKNFDFDVLTTKNGKSLLLKEGLNGLNYIILENDIFNKLKKNSRLFIFLNWIFLLIIFMIKWKSLNFNKYKFVYSDSDFFIDIIPNIIISKSQKCYSVCIIHHIVTLNKFKLYSFFYNYTSYILQRVSFNLIRKFNAIFVYDNYEGKKIKFLFKTKYKFKGKFNMVYNGIDIKSMKKIKSRNIIKKQNSILFYGAARRNKGFYDIMDIFNNVLKTNPNAKLNIAGTMGPKEFFFFSKYIKHHKIEKKIKLSGYLSENKKFREILSNNVIIFPSYDEGWGIGIMESRFLNKNVVCYNLKSLRDLHKNNIYFIKKGNIKFFSKKISLLLKNKNNKILNNKYLYKYDWSKCASRDINFLKYKLLQN